MASLTVAWDALGAFGECRSIEPVQIASNYGKQPAHIEGAHLNEHSCGGDGFHRISLAAQDAVGVSGECLVEGLGVEG